MLPGDCERCEDWKTSAAEATDEAMDGPVRADSPEGGSCLIGKDLRRLFSLAAAAALLLLLLLLLLLRLLWTTSALDGMPMPSWDTALLMLCALRWPCRGVVAADTPSPAVATRP